MMNCPNCKVKLEKDEANQMVCPECGFFLYSIDCCPACKDRVGLSNLNNVYPTSIGLCWKCKKEFAGVFAKDLYVEWDRLESELSEIRSKVSDKLDEFIGRK